MATRRESSDPSPRVDGWRGRLVPVVGSVERNVDDEGWGKSEEVHGRDRCRGRCGRISGLAGAFLKKAAPCPPFRYGS